MANTSCSSAYFNFIPPSKDAYTINIKRSEQDPNVVFSLSVPKCVYPALDEKQFHRFFYSMCKFFICDVFVFSKVKTDDDFVNAMLNLFSKTRISGLEIHKLCVKSLGRLEAINLTKISKRMSDLCNFKPVAFINTSSNLVSALATIYNTLLDMNLTEVNMLKLIRVIGDTSKKVGKVTQAHVEHFGNVSNILQNFVDEECPRLQIPDFPSWVPVAGKIKNELMKVCASPSLQKTNDAVVFFINLLFEWSQSFMLVPIASKIIDRMVIKEFGSWTNLLSKEFHLDYVGSHLNIYEHQVIIWSITGSNMYFYMANGQHNTLSYNAPKYNNAKGWNNNAPKYNNSKGWNNTFTQEKMTVPAWNNTLNTTNATSTGAYDYQSGGKQHYKYNGRTYVVREGSRGGKYILVKGEKKYLPSGNKK